MLMATKMSHEEIILMKAVFFISLLLMYDWSGFPEQYHFTNFVLIHFGNSS